MDNKKLNKLIEQVLAEKINVSLKTPDWEFKKDTPGTPEQRISKDGLKNATTAQLDQYANKIQKQLGVDRANFKASGKKNPADPAKFIALVTKDKPELVFNFGDVKTLTVSRYRIKQADDSWSEWENRTYIVDDALKKDTKYQYALNSGQNNRLLLEVFLGELWDDMSDDEKQAFSDLFFHLTNFGILMNVPAFMRNHKAVYEKLKNEYDEGAGKVYKQPVKRQAVDDPSITSPNLQTGLADDAKMKKDEMVMFDTFFSLVGANKGIADRMEALNKFSLLVANEKGLEGAAKELFPENMNLADKSNKFIVFTSVLDYFNNFAKNIDHGAGAYYFESFLAYMAGGRAGGKEIGASGGMGEADFIKADGSKGSAKYFQDGSEMHQSWKNFVPGYPVEYVVAYKSDKQNVKTSDLKALYKLRIISFEIGAVVNNNNQRVLQVNGETLTPEETAAVIDGGNVDLTKGAIKAGWKELGFFYLPQTEDKALSEFAKEAANKVDKDVGLAFKRFEAVLKELRVMKSEINQYSSNRNIQNAETAVASAENFRGKVDDLAASYGQQLPTSTVPKGSLYDDPSVSSLTGGSSTWQESKSPLDQLIEAVV